MGINIITCFLYSIIFSYCINKLLEKYKSKIAYLILIPFFLPFILGLNQHVIRLITHSWIILFVFLFCYFNERKEENKLSIIIPFAIISSIAAGIRSENIILVIILPLLIYFSKIFSKKMLIIYTAILLTFTASFSYINKLLLGYEYQIHNLSYIYEDYILNNFTDKDIDNNKQILYKIYKNSIEATGLPTSPGEYDTSNIEETKKAIACLVKFPVKHIPFYIKNTINKYYPMEKFDFLLIQSELFVNSYETLPEYIQDKHFNTENIEYKISSMLLNLNMNGYSNKFIYYVYFSSIFLLPLLLIYGIFKRKIFFINFFIFWFLSLFILSLYTHHTVTIYFFGIFQNVFTFTILILIDEFYSHSHIVQSKFSKLFNKHNNCE
jgi:hypothetical protein